MEKCCEKKLLELQLAQLVSLKCSSLMVVEFLQSLTCLAGLSLYLCLESSVKVAMVPNAGTIACKSAFSGAFEIKANEKQASCEKEWCLGLLIFMVLHKYDPNKSSNVGRIHVCLKPGQHFHLISSWYLPFKEKLPFPKAIHFSLSRISFWYIIIQPHPR